MNTGGLGNLIPTSQIWQPSLLLCCKVLFLKKRPLHQLILKKWNFNFQYFTIAKKPKIKFYFKDSWWFIFNVLLFKRLIGLRPILIQDPKRLTSGLLSVVWLKIHVITEYLSHEGVTWLVTHTHMYTGYREGSSHDWSVLITWFKKSMIVIGHMMVFCCILALLKSLLSFWRNLAQQQTVMRSDLVRV